MSRNTKKVESPPQGKSSKRFATAEPGRFMLPSTVATKEAALAVV
jgi:hypothetical protein